MKKEAKSTDSVCCAWAPQGQGTPCPQLMCPTGLPLPSGDRVASQHCHQPPSSSSLLTSGHLVEIQTAGFLHCCRRQWRGNVLLQALFLPHQGKGTANTFLYIVLCFIEFKFLKGWTSYHFPEEIIPVSDRSHFGKCFLLLTLLFPFLNFISLFSVPTPWLVTVPFLHADPASGWICRSSWHL